MDEKLTYWGSVIFSALALVLIVVNISLSNANRALQADVSQRQATINGGQALSQLNQSLVQALAEASVKDNNTQLRDLLSTQGITLKNAAAKSSTDDAAAAAAKPAAKK
jgi:predicted Zn-dependent protease